MIVKKFVHSLHQFSCLRHFLHSPSCLESPRVYSSRPIGLPHFTQQAILCRLELVYASIFSVMNPKSTIMLNFNRAFLHKAFNRPGTINSVQGS